MYIALLTTLLVVGTFTVRRGWRRRRRGQVAGGIAILVSTVLFFALMTFWVEVLWYGALGYAGRFWIQVGAQIGFGLAAAAIGAGLTFLLTLAIPRDLVAARYWPESLGALVGLIWGARNWDVLLRFVHRVPTGDVDPILGKDIGFYLFTLPFLEALYSWLLWTVMIALAAVNVGIFLGVGALALPRVGRQALVEWRVRLSRGAALSRAWPVAVAALALVLAGGRLLHTYHLLYSQLGVVSGPGWTDVHVRLPAYHLMAAVLVVAAVVMAVGPLRYRLARLVPLRWRGQLPQEMGAAAAAAAMVGVLWFGTLGLLPVLAQWLVVEPNEISFERPYIAHNIELTLQGFDLHDAEEREFPAPQELSPETVEANRDLLAEVRLWDWRALDAVYKQFQEIRLYYEFVDVDIDRYRFGDRYRQVMVAAREMESGNLPQGSQTFVNRRFKYTHGYGLTLAPVSDFTAEGLPRLLVRDIPPVSEVPELEVTVPQIYYGELTDEPVFVNTREEEFDYPSGDDNVYVRYSGAGGVRLGNLWRKFLFGWRFDGTRFLFSSYPRAESRVLYYRSLAERVQRLVPFLELDDDPYIALVDGRLLWIVDAYTTSEYFPYSTPFSSREEIEVREPELGRPVTQTVAPQFAGENYIRNSVKVVVDAFHGTVTFYVFEEEDPLIRVWQRIFPDLFRAGSEMPAELRAHVRYPIDFVLAQGLVFSRYHMRDPAVFYNQEDLWVRATETYYGQLQPVEPYYIMWEPPDSERAEFVAILPFTPKNRQVLIGWIAAMCDGDNYGRFLAYKFPKERRVLGPQQVETKIDQDRFLSGQLTLWDQRGSKVIRGNVLAIPIDGSLLYVEPIYLRAETAAYPELRLVVVMWGDRLSYAESFEEALQGLLEGRAPSTMQSERESPADTLRQANEAFSRYRQLQGEGNFSAAGAELERLGELLERWMAREQVQEMH